MSQWNNALSGRAKTTKILIGINVLVYLAQLASGDGVTLLLALSTESVFFTPWTMITSGFAHSGFLHLAINMYSLWIFGEALEEFLGTKKFLWLYLLSILGGSVAYLLFSQGWVVGASGGVFGLMGAYFIVMRAMGFRVALSPGTTQTESASYFQRVDMPKPIMARPKPISRFQFLKLRAGSTVSNTLPSGRYWFEM